MGSGNAALQTREYERVFGVLEACDEASSVPEFAERLLSALGSQFGLRHTTFFTGASFRSAFDDPAPLLFGHIPGMFAEYHADWSDRDGFDSPEPRRMLQATRVASFRELRRLDDQARGYFHDFLFKYGMYSATAMWLQLPGGRHALIGLFDSDPNLVADRELVTLRRLARQLNVISRGLPAEPYANTQVLAGLSHRQREVTGLVAKGMTNASIGRRLSLTEDTVKKYVSRALAATGCRTRTELALLARSST